MSTPLLKARSDAPADQYHQGNDHRHREDHGKDSEEGNEREEEHEGNPPPREGADSNQLEDEEGNRTHREDGESDFKNRTGSGRNGRNGICVHGSIVADEFQSQIKNPDSVTVGVLTFCCRVA